MQVPIALLAIISVSFALHLPKVDISDFSAKLRRVDFGGAIVLVLTIFFLLFGLDRGGNISWNDTFTILSLAGFVVLSVVFGFIEMKLASEPFAPKRIIVNRSLTASYLVNFFGMAAGMSMIFHIALYLQAVEAKKASEVGLWLILSVVGNLAGSLGGGLIMQATGKFYLVTVAAYAALLVSSGVVILMTGILGHSLYGLAAGTCLGRLRFIGWSLTTRRAACGKHRKWLAPNLLNNFDVVLPTSRKWNNNKSDRPHRTCWAS
jgi:hypothetical protein